MKEKKTGTYDTLKMNKVKDHEIVLSHLVAQVILVTISYIFSIAVFVILNILLFKQIMGLRGVVALTYVYLLLLATISFSLLGSCLFKKSNKSYLFVILGYFVLTFLEVIPKINKINPFHLLNISTNLMLYEGYSLKENLITSLSTLFISVVLVIVSLFVVKNKIDNRKCMSNENNSKGI